MILMPHTPFLTPAVFRSPFAAQLIADIDCDDGLPSFFDYCRDAQLTRRREPFPPVFLRPSCRPNRPSPYCRRAVPLSTA